MLEHLTSADHDEALAGDLLEVFRTGKSDGWYWRQTIGACAISWYECLCARSSMLIFVLLWAMISPAWNSLCVKVEDSSPDLSRLFSGFGPIWLIAALILWTMLHSFFLWTGILCFGVLSIKANSAVHSAKLKRGLLLAPLVFAPVYGAVFVLVTLFWYSHFEYWQLASSPFHQITDVRLLADVIRFPYFVALLVALWGVIPRTIRGMQESALSTEASASRVAIPQIASADVPRAKRFLVLVEIAGLVNSMIAVIILCRLPELRAIDIGGLLTKASILLIVGTLAGVVGSWLYWQSPASPFRDNPPIPFSLFALASSGGWLWIPAMLLFEEQLSAAGALTAMVGALVLGSSLRHAIDSTLGLPRPLSSLLPLNKSEIFEESRYRPPIQIHGYMIAIGIYLACLALATRSYYTAASLLAGSSFLFAWKGYVPASDAVDDRTSRNKAVARLLKTALPALLVTMWALLQGTAHRNAEGQSANTSGVNTKSAKSQMVTNRYDLDGYESIILWPYPDKKQIVPPVLVHKDLLAPGTVHPLVIRFTGPYWFVQPPHATPGPSAHRAHGTPLAVNIAAINSTPLVMQAHQYLAAPVRTSRCSEILVEVENRDDHSGAVSMALLLTDGTSSKKHTLYLGQQIILSSVIRGTTDQQPRVFETLKFAVPVNPSIKRFDEISVVLLPDSEHEFVAPKIAIQQFQLFPR